MHPRLRHDFEQIKRGEKYMRVIVSMLLFSFLGGCASPPMYIRRQNSNQNGNCQTEIQVFADNQWWTVYEEWNRKDCK